MTPMPSDDARLEPSQEAASVCGPVVLVALSENKIRGCLTTLDPVVRLTWLSDEEGNS
jgi:hypothetical protein